MAARALGELIVTATAITIETTFELNDSDVRNDVIDAGILSDGIALASA
jgi:hypothetical protein